VFARWPPGPWPAAASWGSEDLQDVLDEKRQTIARSEVLEFCRSDAGTEAIGGLDGLKTWLNQRHRAFSEDARRFGLPLPRGVLLVGPQGTGKSLTAKAIACSWSMPLLRLDVGAAFRGCWWGQRGTHPRDDPTG